MITTKIEVTDLEVVLREIGYLSKIMDGGELGRVYHAGARNPSSGQNYESLVQKAGEQAEVHQGWWHTDQDVINQEQDEVYKVFEDLVNSFAAGHRVNMRTATEKALKLLYEPLKSYAPERPGSTYRRTGELGRGWRWAVT